MDWLSPVLKQEQWLARALSGKTGVQGLGNVFQTRPDFSFFFCCDQLVMSTASRYARAGFRPLLPVHEALVQAAEALRGGCQLEEVPDRSCGMAVVHGSRVLLIHQKTATGTHWALPKGHPEAGESDLAAAIREVREETNVAVSPEMVVPGAVAESKYSFCGQIWEGAWRQHPSYPSEAHRTCVFHKTVAFCLAVLPSEAQPVLKVQEEEVLESAWLDFEVGLERLKFEEEKTLLSSLLSRLR